MDAEALLRDLRREGVELRADGDRVSVTPWSGLDAELRTQIRQCRDGLLVLLRAEAASDEGLRPKPCPECRGEWVEVPGGYRATHSRSCLWFGASP